MHTSWLKTETLSEDSKVKLFCFPFAGAGASAFSGWRQALDKEIELVCIQLPGRENRFGELPIDDMTSLVLELEKAIIPHLNKPWALFGHSMGAAIAYQFAVHLKNKGIAHAQHVFLSAKTPPHEPNANHQAISELSDYEILQVLQSRYGADVSGDRKLLLELMLPTIRADFSLIEKMQNCEVSTIDSDITAFHGCDDIAVSQRQMSNWDLYTNRNFQQIEIKGAHFYLQSAMLEITSHINQRLLG